MTRKEILFSAEEIAAIRFAMKYYSVDMTTTIRILIRTSIIELIAKAYRDGVPFLTADMHELIDKARL